MPPYLLPGVIVALVVLLIFQRYHVRRTVARLLAFMGSAEDKGKSDGIPPKPTISALEKQLHHHLEREVSLEGKVSRREQLLELVLDGIRDAVLVVDRDNVIRFANARAIQFLAVANDPVGRPAKQLLLDHRLYEMIERSSEQREQFRSTLVQSSAIIGTDRDRVLEVDVTPLVREDKDRISRTSIVIRDVTARHEVEQVRRDFVANASHELRTPLSIINGYLENLLDGATDDPDTTKRFLLVMKKHGDRLARLIEDMLTISKLESGPNEVVQMDHFEIGQCVRDVVERLAPMFEEKGATMHYEMPENGETTLYGDQFYWDQIFFNLIENALKENDSPDLNVTVRVKRDKKNYRITVADDGIGIPQEDLAFIFKRFYRVDKQHSQEKKGTGLGLSIVKRAIEAHGGKIAVRSTPGRETAFEILVPEIARRKLWIKKGAAEHDV